MGGMKPWHLLVLLVLLAGPLLGYAKRDQIERKGWLTLLLAGVALFALAALISAPLLNLGGYLAASAGLVGAITAPRNGPRA